MELEGVHLFVLLITVGAIAWADHEALAYMRGNKTTLNPVHIRRLHHAVLAGLAGMIFTGAIMVAPLWQFYATDMLFVLKMAFVLVLIINSFFIGSLMHTATHTPFAALSTCTKTKLILSGSASAIGWSGAFIIGMFFL